MISTKIISNLQFPISNFQKFLTLNSELTTRLRRGSPERAAHNSQNGQIIIILLLAMLVALTIGLSLVQSSITNLSSSSKTEQSSRAFSAAEAGIEKALLNPSTTEVTVAETGNQSKADVVVQQALPEDGSAKAVEYPPIGKADFSHFWIADPVDITGQAAGSRPYNPPRVTIYFGYNTTDLTDSLPAIEINYIKGTLGGTPLEFTTYLSNRTYYDSDASRTTTNNFNNISSNCLGVTGVKTTSGDNRSFKCSIDFILKQTPPDPVTLRPIMLRIRVLYSNKNQPVAVGPGPGPRTPGTGCAWQTGQNCNLPPQATIYTSTGSSGQTEKTVTVFKEKSVPLAFFDYAIFSNAEIKK